MKYFYYLTLLLFAIALSGCSWRMPERPISMQMQVPDKFGEATQKEEKSESIKVGARWWEVLADPVLDGLQDQMARENPNLIALAASVSQAKAAVALAQVLVGRGHFGLGWSRPFATNLWSDKKHSTQKPHICHKS